LRRQILLAWFPNFETITWVCGLCYILHQSIP
jgi:hypothetical protein